MKEGDKGAGVAHATPRPWYVPSHARFQILEEAASLGDIALALTHADERIGRSKEESYANAELIVRAVNAHDRLFSLVNVALYLHDEGAINLGTKLYREMQEASDMAAGRK